MSDRFRSLGQTVTGSHRTFLGFLADNLGTVDDLTASCSQATADSMGTFGQEVTGVLDAVSQSGRQFPAGGKYAANGTLGRFGDAIADLLGPFQDAAV